METNDASDTESERYDSDDDGVKHETMRVSTPLYARVDEAVDVAARTPPAASSLPTPPNNMRPAQSPTPRLTPPADSALIAPFAALQASHSHRLTNVCPRCFGKLINHASDAVEDDMELVFCICCKRPTPPSKYLAEEKRCATCVVAGDAHDGLLDTLKAELPSHLRIAGNVAVVLTKQENVVGYYNAPREKIIKFNVQDDPRIVDMDARDAAHRAAMGAHAIKRQRVFRDAHATLDDATTLFNEWVALAKERVALDLQRLVILDDILASHFLPSTPKVLELMQSLEIVPMEAFPMAREYDASDKCDTCDVLLSPPAPVTGGMYFAAGFCDCCKRMLPTQDMHVASSDATISLCLKCKHHRNLSQMSDDDLEGIPSLAWCRKLSVAVRPVCRRLARVHGTLGSAMAGRFADAQRLVTRYDERVDGLKYHQAPVLRKGNTPMDVSRHWYAEQASTYRGVEAALFEQLRLCAEVEVGSERGEKLWARVIALVRPPPGSPKHDIPEWLTAFVNEKWPKPVHQAPASSPLEAPRPIVPPQPPTASSATAVASSTTDASQRSVAVGANPACGRCAQQLPRLKATGQPSFCDCCELVLPNSQIQSRSLHPRVSLCTACFAAQSTRSSDEIAALARRPGRDHIHDLWTAVTILKDLVLASDAAIASQNGEVTPDSRRSAAVQELDRCKLAAKDLRRRHSQELSKKKVLIESRRALYAEEIQAESALVASLLEFADVYLDIVNQRHIRVSKKVRDSITDTLGAAVSTVVVPAIQNDIRTEENASAPIPADAIKRQRPPTPERMTQRRDEIDQVAVHRRSRSRSRSPRRYLRDDVRDRSRSSDRSEPRPRDHPVWHGEEWYPHPREHVGWSGQEWHPHPHRQGGWSGQEWYPNARPQAGWSEQESYPHPRDHAGWSGQEWYPPDRFGRTVPHEPIREDRRYRSRSRERQGSYPGAEKRPRCYY